MCEALPPTHKKGIWICWIVDFMICWCVDVVICWFVDLLITFNCCCGDLLISGSVDFDLLRWLFIELSIYWYVEVLICGVVWFVGFVALLICGFVDLVISLSDYSIIILNYSAIILLHYDIIIILYSHIMLLSRFGACLFSCFWGRKFLPKTMQNGSRNR